MDLLQIGVRSDGFDVAASGHRLGSTGLQGGVKSYGEEASGRRLGSSGDESNMLCSDDEFDETSYCESSDDEFDVASYREKLIDGIVYFSEHAEEMMDIMDRLCEMPMEEKRGVIGNSTNLSLGVRKKN